jgi:hypothetical protein
MAPNSAVQLGKGVKSRVARVAVLSFVALVLLGAAYAAGRLQTASLVTDAEERVKQAQSSEQKSVEQRAVVQAEVTELEARRRLDLALHALDQRNFGTAQHHLGAAASLLESASGNKGGKLSELARNVGAYKLIATDDLGPQRQRILDWIAAFDAARPPQKP